MEVSARVMLLIVMSVMWIVEPVMAKRVSWLMVWPRVMEVALRPVIVMNVPW